MIGWMVLVWLGRAAVPTTGHTFPPALDITLLEAGDPRCQADLKALGQALDGGQLWAQQMMDAGVRYPVGLLSQAGVQFGDFDECLSAVAPDPVIPQYCLVDIYPTNSNVTWSPTKWAVCLPASCRSPQITASLQAYLDRQGQDTRVDVVPLACTTSHSSTGLSPLDIFFCVLLAAVVLAVCVATIHDIIQTPEYDGVSPPETLAKCLSARYGYYSLFRCDRPVPGVDLGILHGLHACAMFFIILGHRFGVHLFFMTITNYRDVDHMFRRSWFSIWAGHMDLFVDIFFFMSAFLLSVMYYGELHKRHISPLQVYLHRICRLLPVYMLVLLFYMTLLRHLGSGPLWQLLMESEHGNCRDYWWTNALFISTYVNPSRMCMPHTWFLSCDFQLFVCGTLILLLLKRNKLLGVAVLAIVFVVSTIVPFLATYNEQLDAIVLFDKNFWTNARNHAVFSTVYTQGHYRGTSYLPGLVAGFYVSRHRNRQLPKMQTYRLQVAGAVVCLLIYWSGSLIYHQKSTLNSLQAALYAATFHTVFGLGLALIVVSSTLGHDTRLKQFFTWRGFVPLSKLSYSTFLLHLTPQLTWLGSLRSLAYLNPHSLVTWAISDVTLCVVAASVLYLTVETPSRYLMKHFIAGYSPPAALKIPSERKESGCVPSVAAPSPTIESQLGLCQGAPESQYSEMRT